MQTYLWNPWAIFDELERNLIAPAPVAWPEFDIEDTEDETLLTADLPGLTEDDLEVTVEGSTLIVRGERKAREGRQSSRRQFQGAFERRFQIRAGHDLDAIKAHLADGVLTIALAKTASSRPRRIKLGTGMVERVKDLLGGDKNKDKQHAA